MLKFNDVQTHAESVSLTCEELDAYAAKGIGLTRDAAHLVTAALRRDAYEMRERGGDANNAAADLNVSLARNISQVMR